MSAVVTATVGAAVVGGVVSAEGQKSAARSQATAAKDAAQLQERGYIEATKRAEEGLQLTKERVRDQDASFAQILSGATSPASLNALNAAINRQETNVNRQAELYNSLDPAVLAASEQALKLIQGEEAKSLAPLREQRKRQRQELVDRLREQLGPGAETSTAGMQALNQFDQQTSMGLNQAQQLSLAQMFNMAQSGAAGRGNLTQGNVALGNFGAQGAQTALSALAGMQGNTGQLQQGYANVANARTGQAGAAGGVQAGQQIMAQAQGQAAATYGNMISNIGGTLGGYFANQGGYKETTTTTPDGDKVYSTW